MATKSSEALVEEKINQPRRQPKKQTLKKVPPETITYDNAIIPVPS